LYYLIVVTLCHQSGKSVANHSNFPIWDNLITIIMKSLKISKSEQAIWVFIACAIAYFLGSFAVTFFQVYVLPLVSSLGQDETTAVFATVTGGLILKEVKDIKPLPFEVTTEKTKTEKDAYLVKFTKNQAEQNIFYGLAVMANLRPFAWHSKGDRKEGVYALGLMVSSSSEKFIKGYATMTAKKAQDIGVVAIEEQKATREANKANKEAKGKTAKVGVTEQVAKLDIALERGLITVDEHKTKLTALLVG
jgi:hypothetical protein